MQLISLEQVMEEHTLGPNGGLIYCMEFLEHNIEWLRHKVETCCQGADSAPGLRAAPESRATFHPTVRARARGGGAGKYVLFDCPGQIELYTHHHCMRNICERMQEEWDFRVCPEKSAERSEDIDDDDDDCIRHLVDRTKIDNNKNNDQSNKIIIIIIIIM